MNVQAANVQTLRFSDRYRYDATRGSCAILTAPFDCGPIRNTDTEFYVRNTQTPSRAQSIRNTDTQ